MKEALRKRCLKGISSGPYTGKYGPEKSLYMDIFHTVVKGIMLLCDTLPLLD